MSREEALLKAGPVRLRPILMTTAAMVFGMLPTALKIGEGSESRAAHGYCRDRRSHYFNAAYPCGHSCRVYDSR